MTDDEITAFEKFIESTQRCSFPEKERTLFSTWKIGIDEVATSKQLAFFMSSYEPHQLSPIFLGAFFDCMSADSDCGQLSFEGAHASVEAHTKEKYRIDLLIQGRGWVLLIENKVDAPLANDLDAYKAHGERFPDSKQYFAILSPDGVTAANWVPVRYKDYCAALRLRLSKRRSQGTPTKWLEYATDFVQQLENWLETPDLSKRSKQVAFVANHTRDRAKAEKLWEDYYEFLCNQLKQQLLKDVPEYQFGIWNDNDWTIKCNESATGHWQFIFQTPLHPDGNPERRFRIGVDVYELTEEQRKIVHARLANYMYYPAGMADCWEACFDDRSKAVTELGNLARQLSETSRESVGVKRLDIDCPQ